MPNSRKKGSTLVSHPQQGGQQCTYGKIGNVVVVRSGRKVRYEGTNLYQVVAASTEHDTQYLQGMFGEIQDELRIIIPKRLQKIIEKVNDVLVKLKERKPKQEQILESVLYVEDYYNAMLLYYNVSLDNDTPNRDFLQQYSAYLVTAAFLSPDGKVATPGVITLLEDIKNCLNSDLTTLKDAIARKDDRINPSNVNDTM